MISIPKTLQSKIAEWNELQLILSLDDPESRWQLLQIWLSKKGEWQEVIHEILATPELQDCLLLILDKLGIPPWMLSLYDQDMKIQNAAKHYIGVVKMLYLDRLASPRRLPSKIA